MATTANLFANYTLTATQADEARLISFTQDWVGVGVHVTALGAGTAVQFSVQWSDDGSTWTDAAEAFPAVSAPGTVLKRFQVAGFYWRLVITPSGTTPSVTCAAAAIF